MKARMKQIMLLGVVLLAATSSTALAQAGATCTGSMSGEAYVPMWESGDPSSSFLRGYNLTVSNIISVSVDVTVSLYQAGGTLLTDDGSWTSGVISRGYSADSAPTGYSDSSGVVYTISAGQTVSIWISTGTTVRHGYGKIEWTSSTTPSSGKALVANGEIYHDQLGSATKWRSTGIPINGGMPF
jgi:hypothetical protein